MSATIRPYAITEPNGNLAYLGLHESEDDCWRIFLGWPTVGEVREAKARGLECVRVIVRREPVE